MSIYLGFDPEFQPLNSEKRPVLAHLAGFEKKYPGARVFRDGANIELNAPGGGVHCRENLESQFQASLNDAKMRLPKGYIMGSFAAYEVSERDVLTAPDDVREFGCKPSKDAYTGETKVCPLDGATHFWRYAGGHMHFSTAWNTSPEAYTKFGLSQPDTQAQIWRAVGDPEGQRLFVKLCDLLIGVPLTFLYGDAGQFLRRKWYGQAGEYRSQVYGMREEFEYFDEQGRQIHRAGARYNGLDGRPCQCAACKRWYQTLMGERVENFRMTTKATGRKYPSYIGVEYRVPPPQLFNHQAILSLFFGVGRHIIRNFDFYAKTWNPKQEPFIRAAINEGANVEGLLQTVPYWYSPEILRKIKAKPEIHSFMTERQPGTRGWDYFTDLWGITRPPAGSFLAL